MFNYIANTLRKVADIINSPTNNETAHAKQEHRNNVEPKEKPLTINIPDEIFFTKYLNLGKTIHKFIPHRKGTVVARLNTVPLSTKYGVLTAINATDLFFNIFANGQIQGTIQVNISDLEISNIRVRENKVIIFVRQNLYPVSNINHYYDGGNVYEMYVDSTYTIVATYTFTKNSNTLNLDKYHVSEIRKLKSK